MPYRKAHEHKVLQGSGRSKKPDEPADALAEFASTSQYLSTCQAAKELNLSVSTVQKLVESRQLHAWKTQGGHRRISLASVEAYKNNIRGKRKIVEDPSVTGVLRVLFIDSNHDSLCEIEKGVKHAALDIKAAYLTSGLEAMFQLSELKPDVIFTELDLPDLDVVHLLRKIDSNTMLGKMGLVAWTSFNAAHIETRGGLPQRALVVRKPIPHAWIIGYLTAIGMLMATGQLPPRNKGVASLGHIHNQREISNPFAGIEPGASSGSN